MKRDPKPIKLKLIYPKWKKLPGQTTFNLPPHGPVVYAATLPEYVEVSFTDENVEELNFDEEHQIDALSRPFHQSCTFKDFGYQPVARQTAIQDSIGRNAIRETSRAFNIESLQILADKHIPLHLIIAMGNRI